MPFRGLLERAPFKVTVEGNDVALTVLRITRTDQFNKVDTATAKTGAPALAEINIGAAAVRVMVNVCPSLGGDARVTIEQGAKRIEDATPINGDMSFVFDVAP